MSSETLEIRLAFLYSDMKFFVGFPLIRKHVTLNDSFTWNSVFCACRYRTSFLGFRKQLRKTKYR